MTALHKQSSSRPFFHSIIGRLAIALLAVLLYNSQARCGEIHDAVEKGKFQKVSKLLRRHPELLFSVDDKGMTPLLLAAEKGNLDIANFLLAVSCENMLTYSSNSPCSTPAEKTVVNAKNRDGATPLHLAVARSNAEMADLLLNHRAEVDEADQITLWMQQLKFHGASGIFQDWGLIRASDALKRIGAPAVDPLIAALTDPTPRVRLFAVEDLGEIKDIRAVAPLIAALKDPDPGFSEDAVKALRNFRDTRITDALIDALRDQDHHVVLQAATALNDISGDKRVAARLLEALREHELAVIAGADEFFIKRGAPGSEDILIEALNSYGGESGMAQDFVNCGNQRLVDAGNAWAQKNHYYILSTYPMSGQSGLRWGSQK